MAYEVDLATLSAALDSVEEAIAIYDADDYLVEFNARYAEWRGAILGEVRHGVRWDDLVEASVRGGAIPEAIGREDEWLTERRRVRGAYSTIRRLSDGRTFKVNERRMTNGGIAVVWTDISDLDKAQKDAEVALHDVKLANQRLSKEMEERRLAEEALNQLRVSLELLVTERTSALQRTAEEMQIWANAFKHAGVGMTIVNPKSGRFLAVNLAYAKASGMTIDEAQAISVIDSSPEEERPRIAALMAEADRTGHVSYQRRHVRKDGTSFPMEFDVASIRDADDTVAYRVASSRDITERQEIELEKEQQRRELERSNADLERFAYAASHDLKSPLRGIAHLAGWIAEDIGATASAETAENLKLLDGRVARMQMLLDGLLRFSRVGRDQTAAETVNIADLVSDIVATAPPPPGFVVLCQQPTLSIRTHRTPLRVVLDNLIGNSLKHHDRTEGRITVDIYLLEGMTEFRVCDDGPGIAPQFHTKIFEIFQTLATRDAVEAGGIGLAIVKRMVESHGGRVWVESAPPARGATFIFTWT